MSSGAPLSLNALASSEQGLRNAYARLTAALEQLDADLQPQLQAWSEAAQQVYRSSKQQWDDGVQALSSVLNSVSEAAGRARQDYAAAEDAARYRDALGCALPLGFPRAFTDPVPLPLVNSSVP